MKLLHVLWAAPCCRAVAAWQWHSEDAQQDSAQVTQEGSGPSPHTTLIPPPHNAKPTAVPPAPRSAQQHCFFGNYIVPQHEEVAPTPTGCESLWCDTFTGSHAAASEKRQHNLSCTSSKYKTLNGSCSPLTTDQNAGDGWQSVLEALIP